MIQMVGLGYELTEDEKPNLCLNDNQPTNQRMDNQSQSPIKTSDHSFIFFTSTFQYRVETN